MSLKEIIKDSRGSVVIEMCIVGPVLVFIVFVAVNIMLILVNKGIATGEVYTALYNKEGLVSNNNAGASDKGIIKDYIYNTSGEKLVLAKDINVDVAVDENQDVISQLNIGNAEEYNITVNYNEITPGIFFFTNKNSINCSICAKEEIRDVVGNLRRWQIYGQMLSD